MTLDGLPNGTFSGTVTAIVAADGSGLMVHDIQVLIPDEPVDPLTIGGPINVDSSGNFSEILDEVTVIGAINTTNFTGSGTTSAVFVEIEGTFVESGTFTLARQFPLPSPFRNDVVASLPGTGVVVLFNDNASSVTLDPDAAEGLSIGDFDNRGKDDVIARFADGDGPTNSGGAWISENQGPLTLLTPNPPEEVAVGNFDGVAGDDRFIGGPGGLSLILNGAPPRS